MSEHQIYHFLALDKPLTTKQMAELRALSTRAKISKTRFWNEYHWGDLRASSTRLMGRYFDAHLYTASWGTRRLMLRIPMTPGLRKRLAPYAIRGHALRWTNRPKHTLLDLRSDDEEAEYDERPPGSLTRLSGLRTELLDGDLRPAYLAWLLAIQEEDVRDKAKEPPVPPGLGSLTAAQKAMVRFLRIDVDLIAAARTAYKRTRTASPAARTVGELRAIADARSAKRG